MRAVVRLAQGGTLAWLSRFYSQAGENKVGEEGKCRVWWEAGLGAGCIHCKSTAAEESQTFHNDPLYLLYLGPTLLPLSHTLEALSCHWWAGSKVRQPQCTDWTWVGNTAGKKNKKKNAEVQTYRKSMYMEICRATPPQQLPFGIYLNSNTFTDSASCPRHNIWCSLQIQIFSNPAVLNVTAKCAGWPYCGQMSSSLYKVE